MEIVNTVWLCKVLTKKNNKKYFVRVSSEAVYSNGNGWLCDCGHWTTGEDRYHVPINQGERTVFEDYGFKT